MFITTEQRIIMQMSDSESREERIRLLSLVDIFEPLSSGDIERLNGQLTDIHLEPGEVFYIPEDRSEKLFLLWRGRVRIYRTTEDRELTLAMVESGTVFGEMALTAQKLQGAYAQAMSASKVSVMSREDLELLILEKPQVGLQIAHLLSERLRRYESRLEDITLRGMPSRLAGLILDLVDDEGVMTGQNRIKIPTHYTHQRLGTMIGVNREAVTRAFGQLQDRGIVELRRRLIWVTDLDTLRAMAGSAHAGDEERSS